MSQTAKDLKTVPWRYNQQTPGSNNSNSAFAAGKKRGGKFFAHLLGLDHELPQSKTAVLSSRVSVSEQEPAQSAFKGLKLSDLFQGIKLTPNFMFFLLFFGFFLWIFVIYWVRHNEPFANQVLGTPKADSKKAAADRRIVAGIKNAFPVQTSATTGEVYVPGVPSAQPSSQQHHSLYGAPCGTQLPNLSAVPEAGHPVSPVHPQVPVHVMPPVINHPVTSPLHVGQGSYLVGVQGGSGTRVKTIVSR